MKITKINKYSILLWDINIKHKPSLENKKDKEYKGNKNKDKITTTTVKHHKDHKMMTTCLPIAIIIQVTTIIILVVFLMIIVITDFNNKDHQ